MGGVVYIWKNNRDFFSLFFLEAGRQAVCVHLQATSFKHDKREVTIGDLEYPRAYISIIIG